MSEITQYAVIDGASEEGILDFLAEKNPPHCCLYAEPLAQELVPLAPYLVEVNDEVSGWLLNKTSPWGIYVYTRESMKDLRHHLRKYLQVLLPSEEKPVFFRFYDPRNIWDLCSVLSEWELHCFMGPIDKIKTTLDGATREENFQSIRSQFPRKARSQMKLFKISQVQLDLLNHRAEMKYVNSLNEKIIIQYAEKINHIEPDIAEWKVIQSVYEHNEDSYSMKGVSVKSFINECYLFCKEKGIEDDRSVRGLIHLLVEENIYSLTLLPKSWLGWLSDERLPGHYRVESLLKDTLGYIPS